MTTSHQLWPRLPAAAAQTRFHETGHLDVHQLVRTAADHHPSATYPATGGHRVTPTTIHALVTALRDTAERRGYPAPARDADRISFDRDAAETIHRAMHITTVEAATRGVWNFLAVVAMPDLVLWRFGRGNTERWLATDLTRHMFARLWWQALTFAVPTGAGEPDYGLLRRLTERDLNQITERRRIAGNPRLARALASVALAADTGTDQVLRSITPELRRHIPFIDFAVLTDAQIQQHVRSLF